MTIENSKVIDLNVKKEDRVLDFSDFQKQEIKFDIEKLQEAYQQIVKIKKLDPDTNLLKNFTDTAGEYIDSVSNKCCSIQ